MFNNLTNNLTSGLKKLTGNNKLSEKNITSALRDVKRSLLEADVATEVVTSFLSTVKNKAIGSQVSEGLNSYQEFIKLVQDELTNIIGKKNEQINLKTQPPAIIMVAGLQGAGKTTNLAKLAKLIKNSEDKKVLVVSADIYRPAAIEQLKVLAQQAGVDFFPSDNSQSAQKIAKDAKKFAQKNFYDVLLIDTAGRLHVDEDMMSEISLLHKEVDPIETLFVVDAMTGQDAAFTAKAFGQALTLTGVILSKTDGDARGGAALSVKHITGKPIKFLGVGEKLDNIEPFHPDRLVSSILGMGDVLSLVEDISRKVDQKKAKKQAKKILKGRFDFNDMRTQLTQMQQMGGMEAILSKMPGMSNLPQKAKNQIIDDAKSKKMIAMINSMTLKERVYTKLIKGSRKQRIALGSGTTVQDVNKLLRQFEKMQKQVKKMGGGKMRKLMSQMGQNQDGGMPDLNELAQKMQDPNRRF